MSQPNPPLRTPPPPLHPCRPPCRPPPPLHTPRLTDTDDWFMPHKGNVVFGSALHGWGFTIDDFASIWAEKLKCKPKVWASEGRVWANGRPAAVREMRLSLEPPIPPPRPRRGPTTERYGAGARVPVPVHCLKRIHRGITPSGGGG